MFKGDTKEERKKLFDSAGGAIFSSMITLFVGILAHFLVNNADAVVIVFCIASVILWTMVGCKNCD